MQSFFQSVAEQWTSVLALVFGFGFVIFWHELGHFLAAKWAGVKVEQFAVGFGQALVAWRKGIGFKVGTTTREYERRIHAHLEQKRANERHLDEQSANTTEQLNAAADELGLGETEYRLNWIPLGGYVKMLGQDDLNPNAVVNDPRAYNMKPIGKRMVIVSAGVIMNIILAVIGFSILFKIGFDVPPPVVGQVYPNSPAQRAGVQVGDRVLEFDGRTQRDFTKIQLNVALVKAGESVPMVVQHPDGNRETLHITAERSPAELGGFLALGIMPSQELRGLEPDKKMLREMEQTRLSPESLAVKPGESIVAVNGEPLKVGGKQDEYWKLDRALQASNGKPVTITIQEASGKTHDETLHPQFVEMFGAAPLNFAGMTPRAQIDSIAAESSVKDVLKPGDAIVAITIRPINDTSFNPSPEKLKAALAKAGSQDQRVDITVLRDGQVQEFKDLRPNITLPSKNKGLGVALEYDNAHPIVGDVLDKSPAAAANIPAGESGGTRITKIAGQPVETWHDVRRLLAAQQSGPVQISYSVDQLPEKTATLNLTQEDVDNVRHARYRADLLLHDRTEPRQTNNPLTAIGWGIEETRDLVVQFYLTLQRMVVSHSVSYKNMMGPVGIFSAGTKFAYRGNDWLIWFLSMISANLAVVNFLPIPIVDGGLFTFLIIEKIQGRPISPRVQSIAQVVGLALILSIFILVTIQDITR